MRKKKDSGFDVKENKEKIARENYEIDKQPKNDFNYNARQKNQNR